MDKDTAIKIEKLGKKFTLGSSDPYLSLRDRLSEGFRSRKHKREFWALKNIDLEVKKGETLGVIGRNGAGKSTLLKVLSQITPPTEGKITIDGRISSLLEVGTGFHPELSGRENIYLNGAILGMTRKEIKRKFDEIVAFSEIEKFIDTPVKRYSSGMYVRLAFAVAAHLEPEILIVDEVLAVGDAQFQKKCLGKMGEVGKSGRTVLFVSHNMAAVNELCEKSVLLDKGKIVAAGPTQQVVNKYMSKQYRQSQGVSDLTKPEMRVNSLDKGNFQFTRFTLLNSKDEPTSSIEFQEPFSLEIRGRLGRDVSDLRIAFSIDSSFGFPLFNSFNKDNSAGGKYKTGEIIFRVNLKQNLLAPGVYSFSLGANGEGVRDWIPQAMSMSVEQLAEDGKSINSDHGGVLVYPCEWMVKNVK